MPSSHQAPNQYVCWFWYHGRCGKAHCLGKHYLEDNFSPIKVPDFPSLDPVKHHVPMCNRPLCPLRYDIVQAQPTPMSLYPPAQSTGPQEAPPTVILRVEPQGDRLVNELLRVRLDVSLEDLKLQLVRFCPEPLLSDSIQIHIVVKWIGDDWNSYMHEKLEPPQTRITQINIRDAFELLKQRGGKDVLCVVFLPAASRAAERRQGGGSRAEERSFPTARRPSNSSGYERPVQEQHAGTTPAAAHRVAQAPIERQINLPFRPLPGLGATTQNTFGQPKTS